MKGTAANIKLNSFDDLFGGSDNADNGTKETTVIKKDIREIPIENLIPFKTHTFQVNTTSDSFLDLVDSIKENGRILNPVLVRPIPNEQDKYEIISGHRRTAAAKEAGLATVPCIVKDLSDDEATVVMVDSNIQRTDILPSEKAYSYKAKMDALKRIHERNSGRSVEKMEENSSDSRQTIYNYISLTNLIPDLMDSVDAGVIKPTVAFDIASLSKEDQTVLSEYLLDHPVNLSVKQGKEIISIESPLTQGKIALVLSSDKPVKREFSFKKKEMEEYFDDTVTGEDAKEIVTRLLFKWKNGEITL